ncbi:ATP-grasp domain-containing protein [Tunturibacter empetritectus]|uniref:Biotin carboxylase n=2 Tax=Tunturiibacter empetritectus TaxID=3069691 RepID=A0A7W8IGV3_9BACT|nr:ATP-grasp domain-containing protein [Edaphobacter lichenicola]MBB5315983.1 biotin carboxylase [Edaphobacter lichenicola]
MPTILCISTYEKGQPFLKEAARLGASVLLLTVEKLEHADWPRASLTKLVTMPEKLTPDQVLNTVTYLARTNPIDRIVALDEFDLEVAALLREHMRLSGMGESLTRNFRDKLAMRVSAKQKGVPVPEFTGVFNHDDLRTFLHNVPGPWLLKPRTNASAIGIRKIESPDALWPVLDELADLQSHYVLERFVPGEIFHMEGVTWNGNILFGAPYKYGKPPMQTMHQGGIFSTRAIDRESNDAVALSTIHKQVIESLGLVSGVTHTEFIKSQADGSFYFLETAARVGGAHIADVVQFASGINPWVEWARIEVATLLKMEYTLPNLNNQYAGSVICLARQDHPDTSSYDAPEIVHRLNRHHHAGLILRADSAERIEDLIGQYTNRFLEDFCAVVPPPDKPTA